MGSKNLKKIILFQMRGRVIGLRKLFLFHKEIFKIKNIDLVLLITICLLLIVSLVGILSIDRARHDTGSNAGLFIKHSFFIFIGFILFLFFTRIEYKTFYLFGFPSFIFSLILLLLPFTNLGVSIGGVKRCFNIGQFIITPTIFSQVTTIIYVSAYVGKAPNKGSILDNLLLYVIFLIPTFLILLQPDFWGAFTCLATGSFILFVSGYRSIYVFTFLLFMIFPFFYIILKNYLPDSLLSFLDPDLNFYISAMASRFALVRGGATGVGFNRGGLKFDIPNSHSDFIINIYGEEFGFLGIMVIFILIFFFIYRGFLIASQAQDSFGKSLASGIAFFVGLQALFNMGTAIGLPISGSNFPFLGYNPSVTIGCLTLVGILHNIALHKGSLSLSSKQSVDTKYKKGLTFIKSIEKHSLYKIFAYAVLLLTFIINIIRLYKWFK